MTREEIEKLYSCWDEIAEKANIERAIKYADRINQLVKVRQEKLAKDKAK